jgi:excisionase family DNA binding protein
MEQAPQFIVMTRQELIELIEELIRRLLGQGINPYPASTEAEPKIMSRKQAAKFLGVSANTITRWNEKGYITCAKINGQHRYFLSDLVKQLNKRKS